MKEELIRPEYPRPQFIRNDWLNLNGIWHFAFDDARAGERDRWHMSEEPFDRQIRVPFCFESKLSGISDTSIHDVVWYRRTFALPPEFQGKRTLLHFGAVDYTAKVWVNGIFMGSHEGGHTPFTLDITYALQEGDNVLTVRAEDDHLDTTLPRGKQYWKEKSASIFYTRTTGIWQTVWLEPVSTVSLEKVKCTPDLDRNRIELKVFLRGGRLDFQAEMELSVKIGMRGQPVTQAVYRVTRGIESYTVDLNDFHVHQSTHERWWSPETPNLYDIQYELSQNGETIDSVSSYFGMRKISIVDGQIYLNNWPYYMKLVLDQGYHPEGILTFPSDDIIRRDVEMTKEMGFNGARKHQKVEDPRYLYWCDRLGLLVWGEMANAHDSNDANFHRFTAEWQSAIDRDYNHPCIVAWVPLNESWGVPNIANDEREQNYAMSLYYLTKSMDPSRLVISNDGWEQMKTDLMTIHDYSWEEKVLDQRYGSLETTLSSRPAARLLLARGQTYEGQPIIISEFGGISYDPSHGAFGIHYSAAQDEEDLLQRLAAVIRPVLRSPIVKGFCYTQLTDVEQEVNGLLTCDRNPKVPLEKIRAVLEGKG
ncbi:glycoside hydrolase family 2 TIM barrel-domain containing protein [Paenibacillus aurantius]|uniref:Glycoside hydrolase family 2 TIM barrel-domain containing protein n=1 Tax=Paenibacillus aurantius TaxID=2918900 RepID=A0AA96LGP8_9BACL|nr:sugar-binding domain-containing protein [Paenibacillus aurantius]WNQ12904.1 glycoside hydrolase family 2 TIM barrel-domain containing protein [Paenibacillus aurantius]